MSESERSGGVITDVLVSLGDAAGDVVGSTANVVKNTTGLDLKAAIEENPKTPVYKTPDAAVGLFDSVLNIIKNTVGFDVKAAAQENPKTPVFAATLPAAKSGTAKTGEGGK
jgi:hypothetical protein